MRRNFAVALVIPPIGLAAAFLSAWTPAAAAQDSFAGDFDVDTALTIVYGRAPWHDEDPTPTNSLENGQDFIQARFDAPFVEAGVEKHVVIATLTPRPRSQFNCHACWPMLGGAIFRKDGDLWRIESVGPMIEPGHPWFEPKFQNDSLSLVKIGPDRYGLLHRIYDVGGGYEQRRASLIVGLDGDLTTPLSVRMPEVGESAGPGACGAPEQHLDVRIADDEPPAEGNGYYDVLVDEKWNDVKCGSIETDEGRAPTVSGQTCERVTRYRFGDGRFEVLSIDREACMPLSDTAPAPSFRG